MAAPSNTLESSLIPLAIRPCVSMIKIIFEFVFPLVCLSLGLSPFHPERGNSKPTANNQGHMIRGGHGIPKVSLGLVMHCITLLHPAVGPRPFQRWPACRPSSTPLDTPPHTPMAMNDVLYGAIMWYTLREPFICSNKDVRVKIEK
jgi:hypothetical protein